MIKIFYCFSFLLLLSSCSNPKCKEKCEKLNALEEEIHNWSSYTRPGSVGVKWNYELKELRDKHNPLIDSALIINAQIKELGCDCELNASTLDSFISLRNEDWLIAN